MDTITMRRRAPRGMTLIELMISFAIFIFGMVTIAALISGGRGAHNRAVLETDAGIVASSVIAELRSQFSRGNAAKLPVSDGKDFVPLKEYPGYEVHRLIVPVDPVRKGAKPAEASGGGREFFVRVRVKGRSGGEDKFVTVDTVMFVPELGQ